MLSTNSASPIVAAIDCAVVRNSFFAPFQRNDDFKGILFAVGKDVRGRRISAAFLDRSKQECRIDRLGQAQIHTGAKATGFGFGCCICCYTDDGKMRVIAFDLTPHPASIDAVQARHVDVEQKDIELFLLQDFENFIAIANLRYLMSRCFENGC